MFSFLPIFPLAQATPTPPPEEIVQPQEVRPLPGKLDNIPVFNSNSPELVLKEGILLSTFPADGKSTPSAHLNFTFNGQFDIFAHHIAKAANPEDLRTLYLGIIVHNPGKKPVTVDILQAASYLSQPDAPFIQLPSIVDNPNSTIYSGPGDRAMNDILRGYRQADFPPQLVIPAGESRMLLNLPIPVQTLSPPLNGRSTLMRLRSDGIIYIASLARYAPVDEAGKEREPTLGEWQEILELGELSTPRDRTPTPPNPITDKIIYGRVAGVALGSIWNTELVDNPNVNFLTIPKPGQAFSYGLSTLPGGLLGTGQSQSANLLVRYPDTAYFAHGNYGVQYSLTLPLYNPTSETQKVTVSLQTPIKENSIQGGLRFFSSSSQPIFFRGTIQIRYNDDGGIPRTRYLHLIQRRGEEGEPLVTLNMPPSNRRLVQVDFLYPPDASPPQVLTVTSD
ncbi:DUF3370 domain-containing protein [Limnofasciculus baicalensis]|uniref:DUF3370 domain-containing protein n=1 Tax=Limnofasciculus baicalensis BBK-W-15 TaxID=2699891 RepID=A0AAE3GUF3_9CYAN|nr:DUF3370 domain-containing protein [Limnofasciculus baicalensis]MCP2730895.1 DUF3370 domain-containing protein [Limnofasciculus baicalensis BBK-W-15]